VPGRWMMYSHDALGLGHVQRSLAIARAVISVRTDIAALLVTCSPMIDALPVAPGLDYIKLPSAKKLANRHYVPRTLPVGADSFRGLRAGLVREAAKQFDPDLFLVDKSPAGLMGELYDTLWFLRGRPTPGKVVLGLRDILDEPATVREEWRTGDWARLVHQSYDEVWIYGDRALFDAPRAYEWPDWLQERVRYLGYLVPTITDSARSEARHRLGADDRPLAIVTVGGGEDGGRIVATYLEAARRGLLPADLKSVVVLGPCMAADVQRAFLSVPPVGVDVRRFVPDLASAVAAADVVIGMAGYNTVCELMARCTPAVLVPRVVPRREQWMRARLLAERGLAECLEPSDLEPVVLAAAVRRALERPRSPDMLPAVDGLEQAARQIHRLLARTPDEESESVPAVPEMP